MSFEEFRNWRTWTFKHWAIVIAAGALIGWGSTHLLQAWNTPSKDVLLTGRQLFLHEWQPQDPLAAEGDGLGPVFNAKSCAACHFQGAVGGSGPNERNVSTFTALPNPKKNETEIISGVVHADALVPLKKESMRDVSARFPVVKGLTVIRNGCRYVEPDFNPLIVEKVNTPALFGMGEIDGISGSAIKKSRRWRMFHEIGYELQGEFDGMPVGRVRILPDGRVGKFGWKAQFATLEEFVAAACAVEVGLTNPLRGQDLPGQHVADEEARLDLDESQFEALVHFCASLPVPRELPSLPDADEAQIEHGKMLFSKVGCAICHTPEVDGVAGVYSDFLLYSLQSPSEGGYEPVPSEIPLPNSEPRPNEWKTPPLWGVADSAPYLHDGSAATLEGAIAAHGGQAARVRDKFEGLPKAEQTALLDFLRSLKAPIVPHPAEGPEVAQK